MESSRDKCTKARQFWRHEQWGNHFHSLAFRAFCFQWFWAEVLWKLISASGTVKLGSFFSNVHLSAAHLKDRRLDSCDSVCLQAMRTANQLGHSSAHLLQGTIRHETLLDLSPTLSLNEHKQGSNWITHHNKQRNTDSVVFRFCKQSPVQGASRCHDP